MDWLFGLVNVIVIMVFLVGVVYIEVLDIDVVDWVVV